METRQRFVNYSNNIQIARNILEKKKHQSSGYTEFELEKKTQDFAFYQRRMNYERGDTILKQFIVDEAWSMYDCMRFFKIGSHRYKRIKTGGLRKKTFKNFPSGGQLTSIDSKDRDAVYLLFISYAHRCFADDNEPLMKSASGKVIPGKPEVHTWKSVTDVFLDYAYFNRTYLEDLYVFPFGKSTFHRKVKNNPEILTIIRHNRAKKEK